jgi:hypothetical protein
MLVEHSLERSKALNTLIRLCMVSVKKPLCIICVHLVFHNYVLLNNEPTYVRYILHLNNLKYCTTMYGSNNEPEYVG